MTPFPTLSHFCPSFLGGVSKWHDNPVIRLSRRFEIAAPNFA